MFARGQTYETVNENGQRRRSERVSERVRMARKKKEESHFKEGALLETDGGKEGEGER